MRLAVLTSHPIQYYTPIFRELAKRIDLHVFYAHDPSPTQQADAGFNETFTWDIDLTSGFSFSFLKNTAKSPTTLHFDGCDTPEIKERLKEGKFDAVLAFGWHLKFLLQGIWAAKRLGIPVVIRGDSQLNTPRGALKTIVKAATYPILLRCFDGACYVGQNNKAYFEHFGYPANRLFSSPHCVDNQRFRLAATTFARNKLRQREGIGLNERVVLFAGKLLPFKRPFDIVEALSILKSEGQSIRMMVAGSGPVEQELRRLGDDLGVQITFLGFQNQSQMPSAYAASDLLVLPSDGRETWGLVANEALACGLPIVVSDQVGCSLDLAKDGYVGRTFKMGDNVALAAAIEATFATPPSAKAIAEVSEKHSVITACAGMLDAFASLKL